MTVCPLFCLFLMACSGELPGGTTALVVPDQVRLRSSTAEAARTVGELRSGQSVLIKQRVDTDGVTWAMVSGPNGVTGWTLMRNLIAEDLAARSQKLAAEIAGTSTQALGRSKASLKLRIEPDRSTEENVLTLLPSGSEVEILARERRPRPATPSGDGEAPSDPRFDEWYQVRLKDNKVTPAGWIYAGSIELMVPPEISYYVSFGRKIVAWQALSPVQSENEGSSSFLVLERQISGAPDGVDFDRIKVLAYDPSARDYYTPFREDFNGRLPAELHPDSGRGEFALQAVSETGTTTLRYGFETVAGGKLKVTRITPKEPTPRPRRR